MASRPSFAELEPAGNFIPRHIGPNDVETTEMLRSLGATSLEDFIAKVVPENIRAKRRTTAYLHAAPQLAVPVEGFH